MRSILPHRTFMYYPATFVGNNSNLELKSCLLLNISLCEETESSEDFLVTIYNPISHEVSQYVRLPVSGDSYTVTDYNGNAAMLMTDIQLLISPRESVVSQLVPIPQSVLNIPYRNSSALNELVFRATDLPPLGFTSYHVTVSSSTGSSGTTRQSNDTNIGNTGISLEINATTGLVQSITNNGVSVAVQQEFLYYVGAEGNNTSSDTWASGAYKLNILETFMDMKISSSLIPTGDLVEEIHQVFSDWASQVIRVYKEESHVELEWLVGPIPINDNKGKEPISRFTTNLSTNKIFYTDSNGREMLRRERNHRPTWDVKLAEPAPGNYYPVTSKIVVTDEDKGLEFAVLNDRAQGGASMKDGQIEIMVSTLRGSQSGVHRRLLNDDAKGVGEALNETAYGEGLIARGRHFVFAGEIAGSDNVSLAAQERLLAQRILLAPWVFISRGSSAQTRSINRKQFVGLTRPLLENVQVLTLEPQDSRTVLLRLEHILERNEDSQLSQDVTVALQDILVGLDITSVKEMTLDGNKELSSLERLSWSSTDTKERPVIARKIEDPFTITLSPFQIRTFLSCTDTVPGMLTVHLIPHSHDDLGYRKTVDQYYYGKFSSIHKAGVQYIIDTVADVLSKDPKKRTGLDVQGLKLMGCRNVYEGLLYQTTRLGLNMDRVDKDGRGKLWEGKRRLSVKQRHGVSREEDYRAERDGNARNCIWTCDTDVVRRADSAVRLTTNNLIEWDILSTVETAFLWMWWQEQDEAVRNVYRNLINSGQIELIGGGWVMNDEASSHYQATIDQFAWGLRWLEKTFGVCGRPRIGWQIDPFGHSKETASIMAQMGFDGLFFSRLDYQDKESRLNTSTMEMVWEASESLGESTEEGTNTLQ
uniref:alpha-mannosidase n=1 Tax=Timema monikensis TaxID=170555 RepID=A0A7R9E7Y3_9NEOP|nr:unnamed protein product [Timema monikensis]